MDHRFLRYDEEEFRFGLGPDSCADPHVEWLLDGFAFLAARVHLKPDGEQERFTRHLPEMIYPDFLTPIPAAIARFEPDPKPAPLEAGYEIPHGSRLFRRLAAQRKSPAAADPAEGGPQGQTTWRLIGHLSLNYLSLLDGPDGQGADAPRSLLALYADRAEPALARQVQGVRSVGIPRVTRRRPAWADTRPTVEQDRPLQDRFAPRLGALSGLATPAFLGRHALPDGDALRLLRALVHLAVGPGLDWDARLVLCREEVPAARLDGAARLGWTSWLWTGHCARDAGDLVLDGGVFRGGSSTCP